MHQPTRLRTQRGASLPQALVAFLVLSLGMLSVAKLQKHLRGNADMARQRSEAVRLAQEDMETLRAFSTVSAVAGMHSYADVAAATTPVDSTGFRSNTRYEIERGVVSSSAAGFKSATVTVNWADRTGTPREIVLDSAIARSDPALSGALTLPAAGGPVHGAMGRSAGIPVAAKDLGNGRSAFKPVASGTVAWVFDHATGRVVSRCSVAARIATQDLTLADLGDCGAANGLLLSGLVRLSLAVPPDPAHANDRPLPLGVRVTLDGGPYPAPPECWTEFGDRFVAYHCVITPLAGRWSGRSSLVPQGWTLGAAASEYKVCRYSADQDGSGAVDSNGEHPNHYSEVDGALMQQNFLIVRGHQACPTAAAVNVGGGTTQVFADVGTVAHQP